MSKLSNKSKISQLNALENASLPDLAQTNPTPEKEATPEEVEASVYEGQELEIQQEESVEQVVVEDKPIYGQIRYPIVDEIIQKLEQTELEKANFSAVRTAADRAQNPYKTLSMKELGGEYTGPPKYLSQRDAPLEIPFEVVKNLFMTMDVDMDDKISMLELNNYVIQQEIAIEPRIVEEMFWEAASKRAITHEHQISKPLSIDEIFQAVKGRYSQNKDKSWGVSYRPYRDYWILLLLTVNERLFALQVPKVIPSKIKAQYEVQEEIAKMNESLARGEVTFAKPEGIDRKYLTIQEHHISTFIRDTYKAEANVNPQLGGTVVFEKPKVEVATVDPFESTVNGKVQKELAEMPKVTFESKELYSQAQSLCQMIPHWTKDSENPIYQYVPESERPFKNTIVDENAEFKSQRIQRLNDLSKPREGLMLAGTMLLQKREFSPESKIRQRVGFVNAPVVPDCFAEKNKTAIDNKFSFNTTARKRELVPREWIAPRDPVFRQEMEIEPGMKDFVLKPKKERMENPNNISVFNNKPNFITKREQKKRDEQIAQRKFQAAGKPHDFLKYHKLEGKKTALAQGFDDTHNKVSGPIKEESQFLQKAKWEPAYLELARSVKDDFVYGKPKLDLYYKGLKPEHVMKEFGGATGPYKVIN